MTDISDAFENKETRRKKKRLAVLQTGAKLFNERGFDRTTLDDIAKSLNVTKRTLYYYITNKEEILFECNRHGLEYMKDIFTNVDKLKSPPLERISLLIKGYIELLDGDMGACLVLTKDTEMSQSNRDYLFEGRKFVDHLMRSIIEEGINDGSIADCDTKLVSAAIFGAINMIPHWNRGPNKTPHSEIITSFTPLFMNGLKTTR